MRLLSGINKRVKHFSVVDLAMLLIATVCFTVLFIKFAPRFIVISKWWFISILLLMLLKPLYSFWSKD